MSKGKKGKSGNTCKCQDCKHCMIATIINDEPPSISATTFKPPPPSVPEPPSSPPPLLPPHSCETKQKSFHVPSLPITARKSFIQTSSISNATPKPIITISNGVQLTTKFDYGSISNVELHLVQDSPTHSSVVVTGTYCMAPKRGRFTDMTPRRAWALYQFLTSIIMGEFKEPDEDTWKLEVRTPPNHETGG